MSFCGNDDPFKHKTQQMFCTWSVRVSVQNFAIVRHGISEEIGARQNKQTVKYLEDFQIYSRVKFNVPLDTLQVIPSQSLDWCKSLSRLCQI